MHRHLKQMLDDKANMTRLCREIDVAHIPSVIFSSIDDVTLPTNRVCVKNSRGCCGVHTCAGSKDFVEKWLHRQKRRNLPSNEWIVQPHMGNKLDEIRVVYSVHAKDDVRRLWTNTKCVDHLHETALKVLNAAMRSCPSIGEQGVSPFCIAFDFLPDATLLEINVDGVHFNSCPCKGRIERKARRCRTQDASDASASVPRGFLRVQ